jgi:hypothetical protein
MGGNVGEMDHSRFIYKFIDIRERWGRGRYAHGYPSDDKENDPDSGFTQKPTPPLALLLISPAGEKKSSPAL